MSACGATASPQADVVDMLYLDAAFDLAERGLHTVTWNNPRVGCVIVSNGEVIGRGWHAQDGGPHAEVQALNSVPDDNRNRTHGATVYVTLEPCCWKGRTPACTDALLDAGVARVVIGARDTHPKVDGGGVEILRKAGVDVVEASHPRAARLNPGQRARLDLGRPYVRVKTAVSVDGRTAMADGESQWITGPEARDDVQYWRARSGAVVTGIGTVLEDDPRLNVRDDRFPGAKPLRVVVDTHGRTPPDAALFGEVGEIVVACGKSAREVAGVSVWRQPTNEVALDALLHQLADEGCNEVLVESGATVAGAFIGAGLWDELIVYMAPKLMGSSARPMAVLDIAEMSDGVSARIDSIEMIGRDLRVVLMRD